MIPHRIAILSILLLMIPASILPGQELLKDTIHLREISVEATFRNGYLGGNRLDSLELAQKRTASLASLLEEQTPAYIKSAAPGSLATISLRGTLASHTQIYWNGIKLNSPMLGQTDLSLIPTFFTDQVYLISGPASLQSGSGGLGGNIELSSLGRWDSQLFGSISSEAGSFGTLGFFGEAGVGRSNWHLRIRAVHQQSDNDFSYRNTANGRFNTERLENADFKTDAILTQAFWRPNSGQLLNIQLWLQESDRNLPAIMSYEGSGREEYQSDKTLRISSGWQLQRSNLRIKATSGISVEGLHYYLGHQTGGGKLVNYDSNSQSRSWYNKLEGGYQPTTKLNVSVTIFSDYHAVAIEDLKTLSGYHANRLEGGIRLKVTQQWNPSIQSIFLLEYDQIGNTRSGLLPVAATSWMVIPGHLEISSSIGKNFHAPTLNDLYWIPGGNPELLPENGYQGDLKMTVSRPEGSLLSTTRLEVSGFASYIHNWILWTPGDFRYWTADNLSAVFARGMEASLVSGIQAGPLSLRLNAHYSFTLTNRQDDLRQNSGPQLIYIPKHKTAVHSHITYKHWYFDHHFNFVSERNTGSGDISAFHRLPAYTLHHLSVGRQFSLKNQSADVRFRISNLLNSEYNTLLWRAMPGRSYSLILKLDF